MLPVPASLGATHSAHPEVIPLHAAAQRPGPFSAGLRACVLLAAGLLGGCAALGPDPTRPQPAVPAAWQRAAAFDSAPPDTATLAQWWRQLADPVLTELVDAALSASPDLASATARLREARARRGLAGANLFPTVTASGNVSTSRGSRETGAGSRVELYSAGFDAAWEPDVFGGRRRGIEAAQADLEQSVASLAGTQVSLVAEVALNYVEVRAFQARIAIATNNLASQLETLQLTRWRNQAGLATSLDVEQSRAGAEQTRAQIPALQTSLAEAQHRLGLLLGREPGALVPRLAAAAPIPEVPARIAVGIPADTLRRRPDVLAAEHKLAAETARIGEAMAAGAPGFKLSGSIGLEALSLGALGAGSALARSLAAGVSGVLFDAGRVRQQVEIRGAIRDQALVAYEVAVLAALEDVENALVALDNSGRRQAALRDAVDAARNASLLALQRYGAGLIDFQVVLDSQRTVLTIEDSLAATRAEGASALVRLYKALGGGWSAQDAGTNDARPGERQP